jgi:MFS family permease
MDRRLPKSLACRYGPLVSDMGWRRWTLASGLTRLPGAMAPLGLVLAGRYATGSYADGAMLAGVYSVAESVAAPVLGRRLDHVERRGGMLRGLAGAGVALAALMVGVVSQAALPFLLAVATAAAVLPSAVQGGMRGYLPHLVAERSSLAFALDATLIEVEWLIAQAAVAVVALLGLPFLAVGAMLATTVAALPATHLLPPLRVQPAPSDQSASAAWRNPTAIRSYLISVTFGYTEGTVIVALAPLLVTLGAPAGAAGIVLVALSVSSAIGGLVFTAATSRLPGDRNAHADALLAGLGLLALPIAVAPTAPLAAVAVAAFGVLIAPINAVRTQLLAVAVPSSEQSEAFSILWAAHGLGWGISGLTVGVMIGSLGVRDALIAAALLATGSALVFRAVSRRSPASATTVAARVD